jgi:hypothetical protein
VRHLATDRFWACYHRLPDDVQRRADACYQLLKKNPAHPSLQYKHVGRFRSARVGAHYRALGVDVPEGIAWFWIGTHAEYDRLIG